MAVPSKGADEANLPWNTEDHAWKGVHGDPLHEPLLLETMPNVLSGQPLLTILRQIGLPLITPALVPQRVRSMQRQHAQIIDSEIQVEVVQAEPASEILWFP